MNKRFYMKDEGSFFNGGAASLDERPTRRPRVIAFIVVFLLLLVALGFAANYFFFGKDKKATSSITPTITQMPTDVPTEAPTATPSGTAKVTPTKTVATPTPKSGKPTPTSSASTATNGLSVTVLNGSGTAGVAGKMSDALKALGYTVTSTGNADSFTYTGVVIEVKKSKASALTQLKAGLSKDYTIGSTSATLSESNSSDAIVIVGK